MKLDFIIPASPIDAFFSQVAMFRLALDSLGGAYRDARLVVVFGDAVQTPVPEAWRPHFERIEVEWASPEVFARDGYRAQCDRRFELIRPDADLVVLCDADTMPLRPFGPEVFDLARRDAIGGVIAHYHFPWRNTSGDSRTDWNTIAQAVIGTGIETRYRYSLLAPEQAGACPFYINLGFLAGSPASLQRLNESCKEIRPKVRELIENEFDAQITITLAATRERLNSVALPARYNYPNDPISDHAYPEELSNICFIHYLRTTAFDRHSIFSTKDAFSAFLELQLDGSNRVFQNFVRDLTADKYPFLSA